MTVHTTRLCAALHSGVNGPWCTASKMQTVANMRCPDVSELIWTNSCIGGTVSHWVVIDVLPCSVCMMDWLHLLLCLMTTHTLSVSVTGCATQRSRYTPFTRYNRSDNRLYRVNKHPTGCQTGLYNRLYARYSRLSNPFDNWFDNRLYRVNRALQCTSQH